MVAALSDSLVNISRQDLSCRLPSNHRRRNPLCEAVYLGLYSLPTPLLLRHSSHLTVVERHTVGGVRELAARLPLEWQMVPARVELSAGDFPPESGDHLERRVLGAPQSSGLTAWMAGFADNLPARRCIADPTGLWSRHDTASNARVPTGRKLLLSRLRQRGMSGAGNVGNGRVGVLELSLSFRPCPPRRLQRHPDHEFETRGEDWACHPQAFCRPREENGRCRRKAAHGPWREP